MQIDLSEDEIGLLWVLCIGEIHFPKLCDKQALASTIAGKLNAARFGELEAFLANNSDGAR